MEENQVDIYIKCGKTFFGIMWKEMVDEKSKEKIEMIIN